MTEIASMTEINEFGYRYSPKIKTHEKATVSETNIFNNVSEKLKL